MSTLSLSKKKNEYVIFKEGVGWSSPHVEKDNERNTVTIFYLFCHYVVRICYRDGRTDGERESERRSDSRFCLCYESDVSFFSVFKPLPPQVLIKHLLCT